MVVDAHPHPHHQGGVAHPTLMCNSKFSTGVVGILGRDSSNSLLLQTNLPNDVQPDIWFQGKDQGETPQQGESL
jgi:hypothetical protein